jgi:23S rRNA (cytosine1962-C5)-methyltransferase
MIHNPFVAFSPIDSAQPLYQKTHTFRTESEIAYLASRSISVYHHHMENQVILKKHEDARLLAGHQWIFSNEIASLNGSPLAGDVVEILTHDRRFLGLGFFNPHSLISVRFLTSQQEEISSGFFERRITDAFNLRKKLFPESETYRMVNGESDYLPGLIIDKYNEYLSIQTLSSGMDRRLNEICDNLESLLHPKAIVERNDSPLRTLEHLEERKGTLRGIAEHTIVSEHGAKFNVDLLKGQKTGFFLDQRENRKTVRQHVRDGHVLDCFCNEGGFAINASLGGAKDVLAVDISETAVERGRVNSVINQQENIEFRQGDVFEVLKEYSLQKKRFDVVILDPPSFTRSRKNVKSALKGYKTINGLALTIIDEGGFLITASCSHHITEESFLGTVDESSRKSGRKLRLLELSGASPDHPVLVSMPETKYLKFAVFSVL